MNRKASAYACLLIAVDHGDVELLGFRHRHLELEPGHEPEKLEDVVERLHAQRWSASAVNPASARP